MAELADALDLGSSVFGRVSSSLTGRTIFNPRYQVFCQVGGGFVFFWFGLVSVGCGSKMGQKWVKNVRVEVARVLFLGYLP